LANLTVDWRSLFAIDVPILELVVRGSLVYVAVFILLRTTMRRTAGQLTMLDIVIILLIAGGASDAMTGGTTSVTGSLVLVSTIVAWNYALNLIGYRFPLIERLLAPAPLQVVRDGRLLRRNMRRELLTERELFVQLREQGIEDIAHVKAAYIEGDGLVSVIHHDDEHREHTEAGRSLLTEAD
jgi:uncharacterized membrane protein YcaP (DUF421 family)